MIIASYLSEKRLSNDDFKELGCERAERIYSKTGIKQRHVAEADEYA